MYSFWQILGAAALLGVTFSGMFIGMWIVYFVGHMDTAGVQFISLVGVFSFPLAIGSFLVWRRKRSGLKWLKFGAIMFVVKPSLLSAIWQLEQNPDCVKYLDQTR
jgi:hypothetical protein